MKLNNNKKIKVFWEDAVKYSYRALLKNPLPSLSKKMIIGKLVKEDGEYMIIKNPIIYKYSNNDCMYIQEADLRPNFFFIPKGMITNFSKSS